MIPRSTDGRSRILSLSYGKDSMACLGAIEKLGWTLDRILTADVWATDDIPADLPEVVTFIEHADKEILNRYGIRVEHICAMRDGKKDTFNDMFYRKKTESSKYSGEIIGFPLRGKCRVENYLKTIPLRKALKSSGKYIQYIGIAIDEIDRTKGLNERKLSPLVAIGWTEADAKEWCRQNGLLSPVYDTLTRSGCWFCPSQPTGQLRWLRKEHPYLWEILMKWDDDAPKGFKPNKTVKSVHDYDKRFAIEDSLGRKVDGFKWTMLEQGVQLDVFDLLKGKHNDTSAMENLQNNADMH